MSLNWSIHQLTEYFTAIVSERDEAVAARIAVERAIDALGAEFGAMVVGTEVSVCVGLGRSVTVQAADLAEAAGGARSVRLPVLGCLHAAASPLDGASSGHVVLGRIDEAFSSEERQLLRGMSSVLGLALRNLRTLQTERTLRTALEIEAAERLQLVTTLAGRQRLLESLLAIQRAISHREPLQAVLDTVTSSASKLLGGPLVALVMNDAGASGYRIVSSTAAVGDDIVESVLAAASESASSGGLVTTQGGGGLCRLIAAPAHVEGVPTGSLVSVTACKDPMSGESDHDGDVLAAFAEHASLAMTDAKTVELMRDAYLDPLTGLVNRALFMQTLEQSLDRANRTDSAVTILFIDLDQFKEINDSLGHAVGDAVLSWVADRIKECLRADDTAARLGGDEFAVLLERTVGTSTGQYVAERIKVALQAPVPLDGRELFAFVSIGIASSEQGEPTADVVLRNADAAMYNGKRAAARIAAVFEPSMYAESLRALELRNDLLVAVSRGELRLEYQPLVNLRTGAAHAVEALVRWDHPRYGTIPPNIFIPLAESSGTIIEIGQWVLRQACLQAASWRVASLPNLKVGVNVSARQLDDPDFVAIVQRILIETALPPSALTLEITESVLVRDLTMTRQRLTVLRSTGIRLAIDDFGTGYSSLAWLQHLPADQLKIDKSFVDTIETSEYGSAIVGSVVDLARTLQLETVAEGIENDKQRHLLKQLHCDLGQGYLFASPLRPEAIPSFFIRQAASDRAHAS